jgi:hypothetical protein
MNNTRALMHREDYQPPTTPADSPFRAFKVSCLKCGSFKLRIQREHDEEAGDLKVYLFCPSCRSREALPMR